MKRSILISALAASAVLAPAPAATATPLPEAPSCPMLPADNVWRADISNLPVHPRSAQYVASMGLDAPVHADFGSGLWDGGPIGIPYVAVPASQPDVPVSFTWADESDPGPWPVPPDAPIEGGSGSDGDRHVLVVDKDACTLHELFAAYPRQNGSWRAASGAIFDLTSNDLRPATWTSADAAGFPILPGLVRYDEVASGVIDHAIRVTAEATQDAFIWPARHEAGDHDPNLPPMGLRLRLKADVDISGFPAQDRVILTALKKYGMLLADNGTSWYLSGVPDERWDNDVLQALGALQGSDFEAVDESSLMVDPDSGQVAGSTPSLRINDRTVAEGDAGTTNLGFTVTLSSASTGAVTVHAATADGTAVAGSDYMAKSKTITFAPGQTTAKLKIAVLGDVVNEPDETFVVNLTTPGGATIGDGQGVATIADND